MENVLKLQYATLCQKLGDLKYKKSQLELQIEQIEKEIYSLNYVQSLIRAQNDV